MSEDSRDIWHRFLQGDRNAYEWLYRTYFHILYTYDNRFTSDTDSINDCIQDIFTTIYKTRTRLTIPDNVKLYLMVSFKNKLIRVFSAKKRYTDYKFEEGSLFILESTIEEEYIENEEHFRQKKRVEEILSILTPRQKEIIYYRYIQEFSLTEICELMDMNYQSAKNLIQRSLKKIREEYSGSLENFLLLFLLMYK